MHALRVSPLVLALVLCGPRLCWGSVIARIEPAAQIQPVGQTFSVNIVADMTDPVLGWGLDLAYDHSVLTIVGVPAIGLLWAAGSAPDGDGLAGIAFPSAITGTNVLLATLSFSATTEGATDLTLSVTPGDLNEGFALDPSGFAVATFQPGHVTVTPEPVSGVTLLLGALIACNRRVGRNLVGLVAA